MHFKFILITIFIKSNSKLMMDHFGISETEIFFIETINNLCLVYFAVEIIVKLIGFILFNDIIFFFLIKIEK